VTETVEAPAEIAEATGATEPGTKSDIWRIIWLWVIPAILFLGFSYFYLGTHTRWYTFDSVSYATNIRRYGENGNIAHLIHPHHLFFNAIGWCSYAFLRWLGYGFTTLEALQILNSWVGGFLLAVFYRLLLGRGFSWQARDAALPKWPFVELGATLAAGVSFGYWAIATDGRVNAPALLMVVIAIGYVWGVVERPHWTGVLSAGVATVAAVCLHQSHGLIIVACTVGILLSRTGLGRKSMMAGAYVAGSLVAIAATYWFVGWVVLGHHSLEEVRKWMLTYSEDGRWWKLDFLGNLELDARAYTQSFVASKPLPSEGGIHGWVSDLMETMRPMVLQLATILTLGCLVFIGLRLWKRPQCTGWRRMTMLLTMILVYGCFFTIWDPGYWVFWIPVSLASLMAISTMAETAWTWARAGAAAALFLWASGTLAVNAAGSFLRRTDPNNNPELVACELLSTVTKPGDLMLVTGMGGAAKLEVYAPYFANVPVSAVHMELKREEGIFDNARERIRGKIQRTLEKGNKVYLAREYYAPGAWEQIGHRYQIPDDALKQVLRGYDRLEVPMNLPIKVFTLVPRPLGIEPLAFPENWFEKLLVFGTGLPHRSSK
jgi:hypothetical protein